MNLFFPLFYLLLILIFLSVILKLVIEQIFLILKLKKQVKIIRSRITLNNASTTTYLSLGKIYLTKQSYKNAIEIFQKCLKIWDKNDKLGLSHLYTLISLIYTKINLFEFAQFYLEEAIFNIKTSKTNLNNLKYIYQRRRLTKKYTETTFYINSL